jgi:predicted DNA-binding protein
MAKATLRRPAIYPRTVRLSEEQDTRLVEMCDATGKSPSDLLREGFDMKYRRWKNAKNRI